MTVTKQFTRQRIIGPDFHDASHPENLIRVQPITARDVFFIQMLEHHHDKFAPATGCGILLTQNAYQKIKK